MAKTKIRNVSGEPLMVHADLDNPPVWVEDQGVIEVDDANLDLLDQRDGAHWARADSVTKKKTATTTAQEG